VSPTRSKASLIIVVVAMAGVACVWLLRGGPQERSRYSDDPDSSVTDRNDPASRPSQNDKPIPPTQITVEGLVVASQTDEPVAGARVTLRFSEGEPQSTKTERDGTYRFQVHIAPSSVSVTLRPKESSTGATASVGTRSIPSPDQDNTIRLDFRLTLKHDVTLSGVISDNRGSPVSGASFKVVRIPSELENPRIEFRIGTGSGVGGTYQLKAQLPLGSYEVVSTAPGFGWYEGKFEFSKNDIGRTYILDITLSRLSSMTGRVLSPNGQVVPNARVRLVIKYVEDGMKWSAEGTSTTDETGRFSIEVDTEGEVTITVTHPRYSTLTKQLGHTSSFNKTTELDLEFEALRTGVTYSGTLTDSSGRPIVPDKMILGKSTSDIDDPELSIHIPVAEDGSFSVTLKEGVTYGFYIRKAGYKTLRIDPVTASNINTLKFRMEPR